VQPVEDVDDVPGPPVALLHLARHKERCHRHILRKRQSGCVC
jgi:hypothetical protein